MNQTLVSLPLYDYSEGVDFLAELEQDRVDVWRHALEHLGGLLSRMGEFGVTAATPAEVDAAMRQ